MAACNSNEHMLPLNLAKKHALLQISYDANFQDNHCFKWGVYASLFAQFHNNVGNTVSMSQLEQFSKLLDIDFSMFEKWPVDVWTDRNRPGVKLFEKFEDVNHVCLTIVSLSGRYQKQSTKNTPSPARYCGTTKRNLQKRKRKRNQFILDECEADSDDSGDEYENDFLDSYEMDSLHNYEESDEPSFYRNFDNHMEVGVNDTLFETAKEGSSSPSRVTKNRLIAVQ